MNEHQLLCFLTVSRTLNFSAAARELYCTQPALSYQIRSLEKELDAALFRRTTTQVALTEAGRALLPHAEDIYRGILNARTALKGFGTHAHPDSPPAAGAFAAGPHLPHPDGEAPRRAAGL